VLAPTRELANQIVDDLRPIAHARALRVTAVYGGVGLVKQAKDAAVSHVLVATPGRLEDLLARRAFTLDNIRVLVMDEADRMLDMGFRPAIDRIVAACRAKRQTLFFSATLDGDAGRLARRYAEDPVVHHHGPEARRANDEIEHRFVEVTHEHRVEALVSELEHDGELTLVFVRTKHGADRLVKRLAAHGVTAVAMHGNKSQRQREQALSRFESGAIDVLVATDVAARGIDVAGISHVINFDPPADSETYVHRVGRTGRAGRSGIGITLISPDQRRDVTNMARQLGLEDGFHKPAPGRPGSERPAVRPAAQRSAGRPAAERPRKPTTPADRRSRRRPRRNGSRATGARPNA
jgi:superfamily II DNA/RNA helicase